MTRYPTIALAASVSCLIGCGMDTGNATADNLAFPSAETAGDSTPEVVAVNCAACDWPSVAYPADLVAEIGYGYSDPALGDSDEQARALGRTCEPCLPAPVLEGSLTIENAVELEELVPYRSVTGSVRIESNGISAVELPNLQVVLGDLEIHVFEGMHTLRMPDLEYVGGTFHFLGSDLTTIDFSRLEVVGVRNGTNFGVGFIAAETLMLPSLRVVSNVLGGLSNISNNPVLKRVELPSLVHMRQLSFWRNPQFESFDLSNLTLISHEVEISENDSLSPCVIEAFRQQLQAHGYDGPFVAEDNGTAACF